VSLYKTVCRCSVVLHTSVVPKLWNARIEEHRRGVRSATLDVGSALAAEHGLRSVSMSQIADPTDFRWPYYLAQLYRMQGEVDQSGAALSEDRDRDSRPGH